MVHLRGKDESESHLYIILKSNFVIFFEEGINIKFDNI